VGLSSQINEKNYAKSVYTAGSTYTTGESSIQIFYLYSKHEFFKVLFLKRKLDKFKKAAVHI
jgi:hypothetical protein